VLIDLDTSLVADATGNTPTAATSRAVVERVLLAHGYGKHLASFRRDDYRRLEGIGHFFSERARAALRDAFERLFETLGLRKDLSWHLRLGVGPAFLGDAILEGTCTIIRADAHRFEDPEDLGRTNLLGEHQTDARLYRALAAAYVASKKWRIRLALKLDGGGGSAIAKEFVARCDDGGLVLFSAEDRPPSRDGRQGE